MVGAWTSKEREVVVNFASRKTIRLRGRKEDVRFRPGVDVDHDEVIPDVPSGISEAIGSSLKVQRGMRISVGERRERRGEDGAAKTSMLVVCNLEAEDFRARPRK